jgi:phosphoribosylglycinamide formyltransferase 1
MLAVFASGSGSNFEALVLAERRGALGGRIAALFCDRPEARVCERSRMLGIEVVCPSTGRFRTRIEDEGEWLTALRERGIEYILLAGFMRRLHATLLEPFASRILNIHPSLLPAFAGLDAIARAHAHGVRVTGCTVHLVEDGLDEGPIVAQTAVEVREGESLASLEARIHEAEHATYAPAVESFLTRPWRREGRRVVFERASHEVRRA